MEKKSWETPENNHFPRFGFIFKSGISPLKINIFQCFKYRADSTVLPVFETLTNIDCH